VYEAESFDADIYRRRLAVVLEMVRAMGGRRLLDAGCGAGALAVAAARLGFDVDAVDASCRMVDAARKAVGEAGVGDRVRVRQGDAESLPFSDGTFDAAVAVGLLPWVRDEAAVVRELARVVRLRGMVVATFDNAGRLAYWLSLSHHPLLNARRPVHARFAGARERRRHHFPEEAIRVLRGAGLGVCSVRGVGYGPLTVNARPVLPDAANRLIGSALERSADRIPPIGRMATHLVVTARVR
jgi:ubiquinone/menaquinone biosynthesis C-methylase UbiE